MSVPLVTFMCPTYGRGPTELGLLAEKVYWFTRQEYPKEKKELLILNDAEGQTLKCDVEGVRIVNFPYRFSTLGEKRTAMVALAKGDILLPDDDDDISLPGRAIQAYHKLQVNDYYDPGARWYQDSAYAPLVPDGKGCCHHASCFKKGNIIYPAKMGNEDQHITHWVKWMANKGKLRVEFDVCDDPKKLTYVYRWGVSRNHISGAKDMTASWNNRVAQSGTYEIVPVMVRDYVKEVELSTLTKVIRS